MLPLVAAALIADLAVTAALDVSEGHALAMTETIHLLEVAGFVLVWLLSTLVRRPSAGRPWAQATSS